MRCGAVNHKSIALFNKILLRMYNMRGITVQHNHELRKIDVLMQFGILLMSTVLNIKWKLQVRCKPVQIRAAQSFLFHDSG